jgi:hypothetical protein
MIWCRQYRRVQLVLRESVALRLHTSAVLGHKINSVDQRRDALKSYSANLLMLNFLHFL